jgi:hypothetical protein
MIADALMVYLTLLSLSQGIPLISLNFLGENREVAEVGLSYMTIMEVRRGTGGAGRLRGVEGGSQGASIVVVLVCIPMIGTHGNYG